MMPGETHSKTAGIASEAAGSCQNCTSLQQSLNEYVAALIALKQKIIDSDHLLAEYQQKCDDLQYAERENETLRCQLEQTLEKISPQEQHEQELKSLKAELEEKKSTLKIYQQTQIEYIKVKEECEKSDIAKKKLEAKLKKMEEAAVKHNNDYKQLKKEKKVIGKELKNVQKKLDGVLSEKSKKVVVKNAQTQVASEEPVVKLDKQKIKYLLEEIWGCIESSTENGDYCLLKLDKRRERTTKNSPKCKQPSSQSSLEISQICNPLTELDTVQASLNLTERNFSPPAESAVVEFTEISVLNGDEAPNALVLKGLSDCNSVNSDCESDMDEIWQVQDWAKPLPNLLSPIQCSPLTIENVFGKFTDSSDAESTNEMDQTQLKMENILKRNDKDSNLKEGVEHILVSTDHFTVPTTVCSKDGPDITTAMETNMHNLEQTTHILPLQEAQAMLEDPVQMEFEDRSDDDLSTCSKESLTDALKSPEPKFKNPEFCERPLTKIENLAILVDGKNEIKETASLDKHNIQLDDSVYNSPASKMTTSCSPSVNLSEPNDTVGKIMFDNQTSNHASVRCFIANKSPITKDTLVLKDLNPDKDMSASSGRPNITILDCDQETLLHMQSENCSEYEKSNSLTDLHTEQNISNNGSRVHSVDVNLSKCTEENLRKTLDPESTLDSINKWTKETEQPCIRSIETKESSLKPLEQSQPNEPLRQTLPLLSSSNHLSSVSDCRARGIDWENIKKNSVSPDKSGDIDKTHETHEVANMVDKQVTMAMSLNKHNSITATSMESQHRTIDPKDLVKWSSEKENLSLQEPAEQNCSDLVMDRMAHTSIILNENKPSEKSSPENGDNSSSALGGNVLTASPVDQKNETELQPSQEDTCNEDNAYSPKLVICNHLSPPATVHSNEKCTPCSNTSTDKTNHDLEKPCSQDCNLPSVVSSSPVHVAEFGHTNVDNIIKTQCQEVIQSKESSMDLNSSISEEENTILYPHSNSGLIPVKAESSKVSSVVPLEELQHLHIPSESKDSCKKLCKDTTDTSDVSQDSSDSEYEFPVRKVNLTRPALNNPVVRRESYKTAPDATKSDDDALVMMTEVEEQCKPTLDHDESEGHVAAVIKPLTGSNDAKVENNILIEPENSINVLHRVSKKGATSEGNTVECSSDEKTKDISYLQEPVKQIDDSDPIYSGNDAEKNTRNNTETGGQKILPGKNLIWNFSRKNDDFVDPRVVCVTQKPRTSSENVCANLKNAVSRNCASTGKTREHDTSNTLKSSGFQSLRKENPAHRLPQGGTVSLNAQVGQTVLANADTSTNTGHSPETINKVRSEMGPPLPPLLGPLLSTPPRSVRPLSPIMSCSSRSSLPSPLDELISPLPGTPFPPLMSPLCDGRKRKSPVFNTPSPAERANRRILSSPLQFCAATPKHAVPVPGRLPLSANGSSTCNVQENSVKILDTMYPELSARARTLNILKGNVHLNRGMSGDGQNAPVSQITGFKSITSTSTVFIKTGSNSKTSNKKQPDTCETKLSSESCTSVNKRAIDSFQMPKSAKRLRLDSESPVAESVKDCFTTPAKNLDAHKEDKSCQNFSYCEPLPDIVKGNSVDEDIITSALKKIEELCFDLLPVIRSHIYVGTIPNVPVMRNEEKEVIYDFSSSKKGLADRFLHVILKKIKTEKRTLDSAYLQALCRVYGGLCRQLGDMERARILCYSILKEDYPDPAKLLLFVISSWSDLLSLHGVVSKAIQAVLKILAKDDVGSCLGAYLSWGKSPPMNISVLLNSVLMAIQLYPDVKFHQSEKYGEDLTDNVWEYVFAVDLLCSHRKWIWTDENVISKELWPILDKWVKRKKGNLTLQFVPDIIVATVLRLIGHLCQIGLKEGFIIAVKNIISVIITFVSHANEEGVPWGVQLASVYMLCDTAACDPALVHRTLQAWKETTKNSVPPAVINYMQEIASLCDQDK